MNTPTEYIGEHLWVGQIGHIFVILSFISALVAAIAYSISTQKSLESPGAYPVGTQNWIKIGRTAFSIHGFSIFTIIGLIFYMMLNRYYEYEYVWGHVSDDLPFRYMFSAFWEGQEGSFLLWMFWHVVLGGILMKTAKKWEFPVMATVAFVQLLLSSMILGFYFGVEDARIGINPFVLLRETHFDARFNLPNYLAGIEGQGLNPLLQNYWMTIHPPTLFLGFASTLVPFAFAVAGLWKQDHKGWMKPALPWALFSAAILGLGILMGGAWAYEALSFGGYWAWDPVENASLVPWIILVAGIHTMLVAKSTGYSIKSSYIFCLLTFILIIYSTFLTRSGILGKTSVHAFTDLGLEWQLVLALFAITIVPFALYFNRRKQIPSPVKEESAYSKEFWMFVGALVLLFSALLITFTTSIPVFNAIVDLWEYIIGTSEENAIPEMAQPTDIVDHHNRFQLWIGLLIGILSGFTQFLRYKEEELSESRARFFVIHTVPALVLSIALAYTLRTFTGIVAWQYLVLAASGFFAIIANLDYVFTALKGKVSRAGSAVAHIGFGILMIGVLFSGVLKDAISEDPFAPEDISDILGDFNKQSKKNVLLPKGQPIQILDGFTATYLADTTQSFREGSKNQEQHFTIRFTKHGRDGAVKETFYTHPYVLGGRLPNGNLELKSANPNTQHYLHKDIFTLAVPNWAFNDPNANTMTDTTLWQSHELAMGDTVFADNYYAIYENLERDMPKHPAYEYQDGDIAVTARVRVYSKALNKEWLVRPVYLIRGKRAYNLPDKLEDLGVNMRFVRILPEANKIQLDISKADYVVMQALIFPGINLVWLGSLMMLFGLGMGMWTRMKPTKSMEK